MRIVETDMLFPNKEFPMKKTFLRVNLQMLTYRVFIVFFEEVILNYLTHSLSSCAVSCHLSFFFATITLTVQKVSHCYCIFFH